MNMKIHAACNIFPPIEGQSFDDLVESIRTHGLHEAIKTVRGEIVDGRNRDKACKVAGVAPTYVELPDGTDVIAYVISANLTRRHLDESQRAMVAAKLAKLPKGAKLNRNSAASIEASSEPKRLSNEGSTQTQAAKALNVSRPSVQRAEKVLEKGTPELIADVEQGRVSVSKAAKQVAPARPAKSLAGAIRIGIRWQSSTRSPKMVAVDSVSEVILAFRELLKKGCAGKGEGWEITVIYKPKRGYDGEQE